jgi:hypothetical protein
MVVGGVLLVAITADRLRSRSRERARGRRMNPSAS